MINPPVPLDEDQRLQALRSLGLLDTPIEGRFERITQLAQMLLDMPIAAISLVDEDRQWFKSIQGLDISQTERRVAFCAHTIVDQDTQVVCDAHESDRFHDNPLVIGEPGIRFYAGHPLRSADGAYLGSLCVIDRRPREFGDEQRTVLERLARLTEQEINSPSEDASVPMLAAEFEDELLATMIDPLTRLWNPGGMTAVLDTLLTRHLAPGKSLAVLALSIGGLDQVAEQHGSAVVEAMQQAVTRRICQTMLPSDIAGHLGRGVFLNVISSEMAEEHVVRFADQIKNYFDTTPVTTPTGPVNIAISTKINIFAPTPQTTAHTLLTTAEAFYFGGRWRRC